MKQLCFSNNILWQRTRKSMDTLGFIEKFMSRQSIVSWLSTTRHRLQVNSNRHNSELLHWKGCFKACYEKSRSDRVQISDNMRVRIVPVLKDNYSYLLIDNQYQVAAAVDPAEPDKLLKVAIEERVKLCAVLTTHKHWDHSGGNEELLKRDPTLPIFGSKYEQVPGTNRSVGQGDIFQFHYPSNLEISVFCTPCHTRGHIIFLVTDQSAPNSPPILFSGDTLFIGGCGRFFEGNSRDMLENIETIIDKFPKNTLLFCGHEYTVRNLEFASVVDSNNQILKNKLAWSKQQVAKGHFTVPSTLEEEFLYNPFLRFRESCIMNAVQETEPSKVLAHLRKQKDAF